MKKTKHTEKEVKQGICKVFVLPFVPSKHNPDVGVAYRGKKMREYLDKVPYVTYFIRGKKDEEFQLVIHKHPEEFEDVVQWLHEDLKGYQTFVIFVPQDQYELFLKFLREKKEFSSSIEIETVKSKNGKDNHNKDIYLILPKKMKFIYRAEIIDGRSVSYRQKRIVKKDVEHDNPAVNIGKAKIELWDRKLIFPNSPCMFIRPPRGKVRDPYFWRRRNFQTKQRTCPVREEKMTVEENNLMLKNLFLLPDFVLN